MEFLKISLSFVRAKEIILILDGFSLNKANSVFKGFHVPFS
jgi:hypothetical protein